MLHAMIVSSRIFSIRVVGLMSRAGERAGPEYDVGINTPYAGVIDTGSAAAVMIEIRRDVIGNPTGCGKWWRLSGCLSSMSTSLK